jgi:dTDP-glucose 4,6-dehydratase
MAKNRLLVTGGTGFIGHHMIEHIMRGFTEFEPDDTRICILDRLDETSSFQRLRDIESWPKWGSRVTAVWHDLKAPVNQTVVDMIADQMCGHPTHIIHLAASTHVDRSITDPMMFVHDNVVGTGNILEYARRMHRQDPEIRTLIFSTDEVYGPAPGRMLYEEGNRHNPGNPYSAAKAGAESLARAWRNTYKMNIIITNCMNVFGERQHPEKFFPMTINKVLAGEVNIVHADATCTIPGSRYYLHARNCADATVFALLHGDPFENEDASAGTYHIVGDEEVTNLEVVQIIHRIVSGMKQDVPPLRFELTDFHSSRPGHDLRYGQSGEKIARAGFEFHRTFEESLESTVRWFLANPAWLSVG